MESDFQAGGWGKDNVIDNSEKLDLPFLPISVVLDMTKRLGLGFVFSALLCSLYISVVLAVLDLSSWN